jgi:hypothetical protein
MMVVCVSVTYRSKIGRPPGQEKKQTKSKGKQKHRIECSIYGIVVYCFLSLNSRSKPPIRFDQALSLHYTEGPPIALRISLLQHRQPAVTRPAHHTNHTDDLPIHALQSKGH